VGGPTRIEAGDIRRGVIGRELREQHVSAGLGVPVRSRNGVVGAVATYYRHDGDPTTDTLLLESLASILAAAADRSTYDEEIGFRALHDPLTGLPNRALFTDHLTRLVRTLGPGEDVGVAVCDVDDFTLLNQALGRDVADEILLEVARRIGASVGDLLVARIGSDDFAVAVPALTKSGRLEAVASSIVGAMHLPVVARTRSHPVTVSVGLALVSDEDGIADAVEAAGAAARVAKDGGRGSWSHASGREQELALRRLDLTNGLRHGIEAGEVVPHFQPLVDVADGTVRGFEALARWIREDGVVPPLDFIPIAEETGLIAPLGMSILTQACAFLEPLHAGRDLKMSVNVSPVQLADPSFVEDVERLLAASALPREALCLELTETALVPGDTATLDRLNALRDLGVTLAIDDFGTGYSSFAYLTQFPIDVLKLDRALVSGVHTLHARRAVITSVVTLAHDLGITVLAEGVETEDERDTVHELGCDLGQGWFWGRPLPAEQARSLVA
jgi:Amt family ammonium transporter